MNVAILGVALVALLAVGVDAGESAAVDLSFFPGYASARTGDELELSLRINSAPGASVPVVAMEAILCWDPSKIEVLEFVQKSDDFDWFSAGLLDDPDGLNDPAGTTFDNDGKVLFSALAPIGAPVEVNEAGGSVTHMRLRILDETEFPTMSVASEAGDFAQTTILGVGVDNDVTGQHDQPFVIWPTHPVPTTSAWGLMVLGGSLLVMGTLATSRTRR